ncbi:MAG: hypothetical protein ACTTIS_01230 [Streptobacillus sp.]
MLQQPIKLNYKPIPIGELDFFNVEPYFLKFILSRLGLFKIDHLMYIDVDYMNPYEDMTDLQYVSQFLIVKEAFKNVVLEHGSVGQCYYGVYNGCYIILFQGEDTVYGYGLERDSFKVNTVTVFGDYNVKENL